MRFRIIFFTIIIIIIPSLGLSQKLPKDSLFGNVKKIREKVIFLTKQENPQVIYESDYGHMGFQGPEKTISIFNTYWYSLHLCYYINYERYFNKEGKIIKDIWYGKKDVPFNSYTYIYDKNNRVSSMIDSSKIEHIAETKKYYYEEGELNNYLQETMVYLEYHNFSWFKKFYMNGKKIGSRQYDEDGVIFDTIFKYNGAGKLENYTYKNRKSWTYKGNVYKNGKRIYQYDKKNRLIGIYAFFLSDNNSDSTEVKALNKQFEYNGDNLITEIGYYSHDGKTIKARYANFKYDKYNRLIEKYFGKDITKATTIQKYTYKKDKIVKLIFSQEEYEKNSKFLKKYNISYAYKYDSHNNWIEIIKTVDGIELYKWIREIEYY